jgi:hypothetical protein
VTAAGLAELRGLARLADLDLSRTMGAADGLTHLRFLPALETLRLHACAWVSDRDLAELESLANLATLDLSGTSVSDEGLRQFVPGPNLHYLNLAQCRGVTDRGLERLLQTPQLKGVQVQGTQVTLAALHHALAERPDLHIDFEACLWDQLAVFREAGGEFKRDEDDGRIIGLRLPHSVAGLPYQLLAELTAVREVSLGGQEIDDGVLQYVCHMPELRTLNLTDTRVTGAGLRELSGLPHFESLSLRQEFVTREDVEALASLTNLSELRLSRGVVGPGAMAALRELSQLDVLHLEGARMPPAAVARLQRERPDLTVSGFGAARNAGRRFMLRRLPANGQRLFVPRRS